MATTTSVLRLRFTARDSTLIRMGIKIAVQIPQHWSRAMAKTDDAKDAIEAAGRKSQPQERKA